MESNELPSTPPEYLLALIRPETSSSLTQETRIVEATHPARVKLMEYFTVAREQGWPSVLAKGSTTLKAREGAIRITPGVAYAANTLSMTAATELELASTLAAAPKIELTTPGPLSIGQLFESLASWILGDTVEITADTVLLEGGHIECCALSIRAKTITIRGSEAQGIISRIACGALDMKADWLIIEGGVIDVSSLTLSIREGIRQVGGRVIFKSLDLNADEISLQWGDADSPETSLPMRLQQALPSSNEAE